MQQQRHLAGGVRLVHDEAQREAPPPHAVRLIRGRGRDVGLGVGQGQGGGKG